MRLIRSTLDLESRVMIMGVLNVTPDSFSDGGDYQDLERAVARAFEIEAEGADLLDIGGESTRPGAPAVDEAMEIGRVIPLIERLAGRLRIPISIDTTKSAVARAAVQSGAEMINDVSGLRFDPLIAAAAAETGAGLILMHSRGTPATMQKLPPVAEIWEEVIAELGRAFDEACARGVARERVVLDPGIGFGKTPEQNLELINGLDRLVAAFALPVLLGPSRKSFIKRTLERAAPNVIWDEARARLGGTAAALAIGILRGARLVRVHDIAEMAACVRLVEAIRSAEC
jgi:dihydropteroate synthase